MDDAISSFDLSISHQKSYFVLVMHMVGYGIHVYM
jgi:hypothetical protein